MHSVCNLLNNIYTHLFPTNTVVEHVSQESHDGEYVGDGVFTKEKTDWGLQSPKVESANITTTINKNGIYRSKRTSNDVPFFHVYLLLAEFTSSALES